MSYISSSIIGVLTLMTTIPDMKSSEKMSLGPDKFREKDHNLGTVRIPRKEYCVSVTDRNRLDWSRYVI